MNAPQDICIIDFCGRVGHRYPVSVSADWDGEIVYFSGGWRDVPDMPASSEPTDNACEDWVVKHLGSLYGWWDALIEQEAEKERQGR